MSWTQCVLKRTLAGGGDSTLVSYIRNEFAVVGKKVWVEGIDGIWRVEFCGEMVDNPENPVILFREHKKRTGDSERKIYDGQQPQ